MSIIICQHCEQKIDTDFDCEHEETCDFDEITNEEWEEADRQIKNEQDKKNN